MSTRIHSRYTSRRTALTLATVLACCLGSWSAPAQTNRLGVRPLTPQEIKDFGLPGSTQKGYGGRNVGIGQPVYMEALIAKGTVVTQVNWSILTKPTNSTATILVSPLSNSVPPFDFGDRNTFDVAARAVLVPDATNFYFNPDYTVAAAMYLTNKIVTATNIFYGTVYIGDGHYLCLLCHAGKRATVTNTLHGHAFIDNIQGVPTNHFSANCIICHTAGYDTTPIATNGGFDDIATKIGWVFPGTPNPTNWTGMNTNLQSRANVQCENCHGPADRHYRGLGDTNAITLSLSGGDCAQCHDSLTHHVKVFEWEQTLHFSGEVFRATGSCTPCHSAVGFIAEHDPDYATNNRIPKATGGEGITCQTCHDPHSVGMGDHQLRAMVTIVSNKVVNTTPSATLMNGYVITNGGDGILCMNCHHSRQDATNYVLGSSVSSFNVHFGVQGDMLAGQNGIEYGLNMPRSRHLQAVENSCVGCHMQLVEGTPFASGNTHVGGHTFMLTWDGGTPGNTNDDLKVTEVCSVCHVESGTFNFGGEDYDHNGTVDGLQTEIDNLLTRLSLLLPPLGSTNITSNSSYTPAQKKAVWNYYFVSADGSHGVHNPKYASALLWASIQDLSGGIDSDLDGLPDAWELANFGNLTSQSGNDDYDGDGLSNALEWRLGTNPKSSDTDNDGFSDKVELEAGSNPLLIGDIPSTNLVGILPAIELKYLPGTPGVTQSFEYVNTIGTAGWTNAGPNFVSSNQWAYQLMTLRDGTQKFFRVKSK